MKDNFWMILTVCCFIINLCKAIAQTPMISLSVRKHAAEINAMAFTSDSTRLITVSQDKTLKVWNYPSQNLLYTIYMPDNGGETGQLTNCAVHPDDRYVVVSGRTGIKRPNARISNKGAYSFYIVDLLQRRIVDKEGAFDSPVSSLSFSPNGNYLAVSAQYNDATIYRFANIEFLYNFHLEDEKIISIGFLSDSLVYILSDYRLRFYEINVDESRGIHVRNLAKFRSKRMKDLYIWEQTGYLGIGGYIYKYNTESSKIIYEKISVSEKKQQIPTINPADFVYRNVNQSLIVKEKHQGREKRFLKDSRYFSISKEGDSILIKFIGEPMYCYTFFNKSDKQVITLENSLDPVPLNINVSTETEHSSFLSMLEEYELSIPLDKNEWIYTQDGLIIHEDAHGTYFERFLPMPAVLVKKWRTGEYFICLLVDGTLRWFDSSTGDEILTLYVSPKGEWLFWCPEGYYYAESPDVGINIIYCKQNYLEVETMNSYEMRRYFYNRKEIQDRISWIFGHDRNDDIASQKWVLEHFMDADYPSISIDQVVEIAKEEETTYQIHFTLNNKNPLKYGYLDLELVIDSVAYPLDQLSLDAIGGRFNVTLPSDADHFELLLLREDGGYLNSDEYRLSIQKQYNRCRMLLVGVAKYDLHNFAPLSSSRNDVADLQDALQRCSMKEIGDNREIRSLVDEAATAESILAQITSLAQTSTEKDMHIIYFSGHGTWKNEHYYLIPYGLRRQSEIEENGISAESFMKCIQQIKGLKVVIIDACYSGALLSFATSDMVLYASSEADSYSLDGSSYTSSLFTNTLIDIFSRMKYWGKRELSLGDLGSILMDRFKDQQVHPVCRIPEKLKNYRWLNAK